VQKDNTNPSPVCSKFGCISDRSFPVALPHGQFRRLYQVMSIVAWSCL
jgi:hypothetical protein